MKDRQTKTILSSCIASLISMEGDIPLDRFLDIVIKYYYQNHSKIGKDFITAPEASQMFGEILAIWCAHRWHKYDMPIFSVTEFGAGNGTMLQDFLRAAKSIDGLYDKILKINIVEISPTLIEIQKRNLSPYIDKIHWCKFLPNSHQLHNIIICNEFFDALPCKQFIKKEDGFKEVFIGLNQNKDFAFYFGDQSIGHLADKQCPSDGIIELPISYYESANNVANMINSSFSAALIIDYGHLEKSYISSLQALHSHKYIDIFDNLGEADITYHVDFKFLANIFAQNKLQTSLQSQGEFLSRYGIHHRADRLIKSGANIDAIQSALNRLVLNDQMGALFKVLEVTQSK